MKQMAATKLQKQILQMYLVLALLIETFLVLKTICTRENAQIKLHEENCKK